MNDPNTSGETLLWSRSPKGGGKGCFGAAARPGSPVQVPEGSAARPAPAPPAGVPAARSLPLLLPHPLPLLHHFLSPPAPLPLTSAPLPLPGRPAAALASPSASSSSSPPPLSLTLPGFQQHRVGHDVLDFHGRGLLPLRAAGVEAAPAASFAPSSSPATAATPSRRSSGPAGPQRRARLFPITRRSLRHRPPPSPRAEARSRQRPPRPSLKRPPQPAPPRRRPRTSPLRTTTPRRHRKTELALSQARAALCMPGYAVSDLVRPRPAFPSAAGERVGESRDIWAKASRECLPAGAWRSSGTPAAGVPSPHCSVYTVPITPPALAGFLRQVSRSLEDHSQA